MSVTISLSDLEAQTKLALQRHGADEWIAVEVAKAVRKAEATGNVICGLYYLESYCQQLTTGRVKGNVDPEVSRPKPACVKVDAKFGFAQAAFAKGLPDAIETARALGTCSLAICHAHTCTSLGYFTEQIAEAGFIGIGFTNASAAVSPPNGKSAVLGTNPIAMAVPARGGGVAFQFDQSTSAVALGKITMAAAANEKIPLGWAVDSDGNPTNDPKKALSGSLVSSGGHKGYGFGLMAEILAAGLTGSVNSLDVKGLKVPAGEPHNLGQFYFLIDPTAISGEAFWERLKRLTDAVEEQENARLPGANRVLPDSVTLDEELWNAVQALANPTAQEAPASSQA
ncbi:MAG: Ldh family oxidoreductase [Pseudomonadota bacterium]